MNLKFKLGVSFPYVFQILYKMFSFQIFGFIYFTDNYGSLNFIFHPDLYLGFKQSNLKNGSLLWIVCESLICYVLNFI